MSIEVLLLANVDDLGREGDVVKVKDGFARNYLLPKNLAAPVTTATRRRLEKIRERRDEAELAGMSTAKALAEKIEKTACTVPVKTGEEGKLFGSVTAAHIVDVMKAAGIALDKHQVVLAEPIRALGVFTVEVRLNSKVTAPLKVWVVEE